MLNRIDELFKNDVDFAFETTLSSKIYRNKIVSAQGNNYKVTLLFFWLKNVELAIERVQKRVSKGGHDIPKDVIKRRYKSGIRNLFDIYLPLCDEIIIADSSNTDYDIIATKNKGEKLIVVDKNKWEQIKF